MDWYIVILVMLLFNVAVEQRAKRSKKNIATVALQFSCFILLFFMAMRSQSVGADTSGYCRMFVQGYSGEKMEKGYLLFNKILRLFFANPQTITIANSLLLIFLLYQSVKRLSPIPQLSIWLYVTLGVFQTEMNLTRNAIAIMMCYLSTQYISRKQPVKYCACILLASSFHLTSLLFLPLYWLVRHVRLDRKKMVFLVLAVVIVPVFIRSITSYIYIYLFVIALIYLGLSMGRVWMERSSSWSYSSWA